MEVGDLDGKSFTDLYMYQAGLGNTPKQWHFWSAISLLAACLGNNIWVNLDGTPLYPNLYTFLVGGSGVGKGVSIMPAAEYVSDDDIYIHKHNTLNMTK